MSGSVSFGCGQLELMSRDYPRSALSCFHINQNRHKKANCLRLSGGAMAVPAPATLWNTDGLKGKVEAHMVKSRALQLTTNEACAAPDIVTSMRLISIFF